MIGQLLLLKGKAVEAFGVVLVSTDVFAIRAAVAGILSGSISRKYRTCPES
jgi:hypothetical protein